MSVDLGSLFLGIGVAFALAAILTGQFCRPDLGHRPAERFVITVDENAVLVLSSPVLLKPEQREHLRQHVTAALQHRPAVLVLEHGITLSGVVNRRTSDVHTGAAA